MKIIQLTKEQIECFPDIDPFFIADRLDIPGYFALGVVEEIEDENIALPYALLVGSIYKDRPVIEWLSVRPEVRDNGIGELLLDAAFDVAKEGGYDELYAYVSSEAVRVNPQAPEFFRERLFHDAVEVFGEWEGMLRDLDKEGVLEDAEVGMKSLYPLSALPSGEKRKVTEYLEQADAWSLYKVGTHSDLLEEDLSFVVMGKNGVSAALLIQYAGGKLYPVYMKMGNSKETDGMVAASLKAAKKKYSPHAILHISLRTMERSKDKDMLMLFLEDIIPKKHNKGRFFVAQVGDYDLEPDYDDYYDTYDDAYDEFDLGQGEV
ncbi:MAG: GNAT family N-acetyltransferase [Lachnospiraceae bacterium]|nr:GNAT family N-acetyltransferase [Lachnospiraceae bacterium]